jgi:hypothetical protein
MSRKPRAGEAGKPFTIKVTDTERAAWAAAAGDRPLSAWARAVLNRAARRPAAEAALMRARG